MWKTIHSHNSLPSPFHAGQQLGHTLLWDAIPFVNQHLSRLWGSFCTKTASSDDKPCFYSEGDDTPYHHTVSTKSCYPIQSA